MRSEAYEKGSAIYDTDYDGTIDCDPRFLDSRAPGGPLTCGNQSTYNRVANAGIRIVLTPFKYPWNIEIFDK